MKRTGVMSDGLSWRPFCNSRYSESKSVGNFWKEI
jgi:hypothetical protein